MILRLKCGMPERVNDFARHHIVPISSDNLVIQFNSMVYSHNTVQNAYNICTSYNTMYK